MNLPELLESEIDVLSQIQTKLASLQGKVLDEVLSEEPPKVQA
jgi:hypothetical protein